MVKRKSTKNPPMLSHEFVIQNHADIVACVAMVFVVGLMFQVSSPLASLFIALHHNVSVPMEVLPGQIQDVVHYTAGAKASFRLKLNDNYVYMQSPRFDTGKANKVCLGQDQPFILSGQRLHLAVIYVSSSPGLEDLAYLLSSIEKVL